MVLSLLSSSDHHYSILPSASKTAPLHITTIRYRPLACWLSWSVTDCCTIDRPKTNRQTTSIPDASACLPVCCTSQWNSPAFGFVRTKIALTYNIAASPKRLCRAVLYSTTRYLDYSKSLPRSANNFLIPRSTVKGRIPICDCTPSPRPDLLFLNKIVWVSNSDTVHDLFSLNECTFRSLRRREWQYFFQFRQLVFSTHYNVVSCSAASKREISCSMRYFSLDSSAPPCHSEICLWQRCLLRHTCRPSQNSL